MLGCIIVIRDAGPEWCFVVMVHTLWMARWGPHYFEQNCALVCIRNTMEARYFVIGRQRFGPACSHLLCAMARGVFEGTGRKLKIPSVSSQWSCSEMLSEKGRRHR